MAGHSTAEKSGRDESWIGWVFEDGCELGLSSVQAFPCPNGLVAANDLRRPRCGRVPELPPPLFLFHSQFISSSKTLPPIAICKTSQRNFWRVHSGQSSQAYITANIISIIRESKLLHRYPVTRPRASALTHKGVTTVLYIFQRKHASTASKFFNKPVRTRVIVAGLALLVR